MFAIKCVELGVVRGTVFGTIPPAPIASLRCEQRFLRLPQSLFSRSSTAALCARFLALAVRFACVPEQLPRLHIFCVADPYVEVGVDPGAGKNAAGTRNASAGCCDRFARSHGTEIAVVLNAAIKFAEKFAAVSRIVLPGILSV